MMVSKKLILASKSIDRKELLKRVKIPFIAIHSDINEEQYKNKINDPFELVKRLAKEKALSVKIKINKKYPEAIIIAADTIVFYNQEIIGKAKNQREALDLLKELMGNTHQLITGIALMEVESNKIITAFEKTEVTFLSLSNEEIWNYIKTQEWIGRAGAYSLRERASLFIDSIQGSYSNVLGLPINKIYQILKEEFKLNLFQLYT